MKKHLTIPFLLAAMLTQRGAATIPDLLVEVNGPDVVLSWDATPLNPGSTTELFYAFQLEKSTDLENWQDVGTEIAGRIGGGTMPHSVTVPVETTEPYAYFRLSYWIDLNGQNLNGADFSGVDFGTADLSGVDLSYVDLQGANLLDAQMNPAGISQLGGPFGRPIHDSMPNLPYAPDLGTFVEENGQYLSDDTLLLLPALTTTTGHINDLLIELGGRYVGGFPGDCGQGIWGLVIVRFPNGGMDDFRLATEFDPAIETTLEERFYELTALPDLTNTNAVWNEWNPLGTDDNGSWGIRNCRVPQMWNLTEPLEKLAQAGDRPREINIGQIESGYFPSHEEMTAFQPLDASSTSGRVFARSHGTNVCGIMAANYYDGRGVSGVHPSAKVFGVGSQLTGPTIPIDGAVAVGEFYSDFVQLLLNVKDLKVINVSMAYFWRFQDPNLPMPAWVSADSKVFQNVVCTRNPPIIVKAAGNQSLAAPWIDGVNHAALVSGVPDVFVVEALQGDATGNESLVTQWPGDTIGSNSNGNLSAPGYKIGLAHTPPSDYLAASGTSYAAPLVSGIIAYLYWIEPTLTKAEVMNLITSTAKPIAGASPKIDAFAAAMAIDTIRPGNNVLRMLLDIDDGTVDGCERVRRLAKVDALALPTTFDEEPVGGNDYNRLGDGKVDMSDFRRFRDWNLIVREEEGDAPADDGLDGPRDHPQKDPNRNRKFYDQDLYDRFYPRSDFNGDGRRYAPDRKIPGVGLIDPNVMVNDLDVFGVLFNDPDTGYAAADLPGLVESSDIHISLYWFMKWNEGLAPGDRIEQVRIRVESDSGTRQIFFDVPEGAASRETHLVFTLPTSESHYVIVCGDTGTGEFGEWHDFTFDNTPGRDFWFAPRVMFDCST